MKKLRVLAIFILLLASCAHPLIDATQKNQTEKAEKLLESKFIDVNVKNKNGWTPLHYASLNNNKELVNRLIEKGADVNGSDTSIIGKKPIHLASAKGNTEIAKILVKNGADVNAKDAYWCFTPLIYAALIDDMGLVKFLVENNAQVNYYTHRYQLKYTPLISAIANGNMEMLKYFVKNGGHLSEDDTQELITALYNKKYDIAEYIIDSAYKGKDGACISYVVQRNDTTGFDLLLKKGFDVNKADPVSKATPIFYSCAMGNMYFIKNLVEKNANINQHNTSNIPPIFYAAFNNHEDIVNYLINNGSTQEIKPIECEDQEQICKVPYVKGIILKVLARKHRDQGEIEDAKEKYKEAIVHFNKAEEHYKKYAHKEGGKQFWGTVGNIALGSVESTVGYMQYGYNYSNYYPYNNNSLNNYFETKNHGSMKDYLKMRSKIAEEQSEICRNEMNAL